MVLPATAFSHAGERGFIMLLPTTEWIVAGTLVVVATFCILLFAPSGKLHSLQSKQKLLLSWSSTVPQDLLGLFFLLFYLVLIAAGIFGSSDPLANPIGPVIWSWFWVGMVFLHLLFGNVWTTLNPFEVAHRLLLKIWPRSESRADFPSMEKLRYWPAIALLIGLTWFENVSLSPYDSEILARVMVVYFVVTLGFMRWFGRDQWLQYGEVFSVYFKMISWLAPVNCERSETHAQLFIRWPFVGLMRVGALPLSGVLFVLFALACVTFDGASHTYWWLSLWHINPLEFGGRSTVLWQSSFGLLAACCLLSILYTVSAGCVDRQRKGDDAGKGVSTLAVSLVPIAFGYHFAHYLPAFALESQFALKAVSDPFALGWDLFGTADRPVIASVRSSFVSIKVIWITQMAAVVFSHVVSVLIAHLVIEREFGGSTRSKTSELPYAILMIGYTFIGLWLLSTPSL